MKKTKENQLGITMIALIVTVIVLLILAGISIATLNGDSGIIKKSKEDNDLLSSVGQMSLCFTEVIVFSILAILSKFIGEKIFIVILVSTLY